jgi:hypothetical protein
MANQGNMLTETMAKWNLEEKVDHAAPESEFSCIPGFHTVVRPKPKTKFIKVKTLEEKLADTTKDFPEQDFARATIITRNAQRSSLGGRKKILILNFRAAVRALNQEQSLLDELEETDDNVFLLIGEKKTTRKLTDPKGVAAENSARRWECKQARLQADADQMVHQQQLQWKAQSRKRLKRNGLVDDEAEEAPPGEEEEDAASEER